ncbi:MAG: HAD-IA family hydrolase [Coriobacteriales bacterium]|jgi:putative hydrolase of the HAD superfamily|nr:HAD-IA family hydrolase [Coriobacteriales bacterium]
MTNKTRTCTVATSAPAFTTVFFDVGNTLLTTAEEEGLVFCEEAARCGVHVGPDDVMREVPRMYQRYDELYSDDDSFWSDDERAVRIWLDMYSYLCELLGVEESKHAQIAQCVHRRYFTPESWRPFDDVRETLETLKAHGVRMGLISNWDSTLEGIINGIGLGHYFEVVVASTVVQLHKPMPEIFELALKGMGVAAEKCLHVGDHVVADVQGARSVGITPVLIDRNGTLRAAAEPGTCVMTSLVELEDVVVHGWHGDAPARS